MDKSIVREQVAISLPELDALLTTVDQLIENGSTVDAAIDVAWLTGSLAFRDTPFMKEHIYAFYGSNFNVDSEEVSYILRSIAAQGIMVGSLVYYHHPLYGKAPATVLSIMTRVKVRADFKWTTKDLWTVPGMLEHQFTNR